jgi:signal transduction histidine kinase
MPALPDPLALVVVEDSEDDYALIVASLSKSVIRLTSRRVDTAEALEAALAAGRPDAVISDHRMPRFSSFEALKIVREADADLPFVIVSGTIGEHTAVEAMREGASDYLMKDDLSRLAPALARALETAAVRRRRREVEAALIDNEARFRALTANLPGVVFQVERVGGRYVPLYASDGTRRLLGIDPERLIAAPEALLSRLPAADLAELALAFRDSAERGTPVRWIGRVPPRDGADAEWLEVAAGVRRTAPDRVVWDGIAVDVTPLIRTEHALAASQEELRELARHVAAVAEREREALSRELHDEVGSMLTGLRFQLAWLREKLKDERRFAAPLRRANELVEAAIGASSRIMQDLRPPILDAGIVAALEWLVRQFAERMDITAVFDGPPDEPVLTPEEAIVVFRIAQEALTNAAKHAKANRVDVQFELADDTIRLDVRDDGRGIETRDLAKVDRFGLRGMRERAASLGGRVEIEPGEHGGTDVRLSLPRHRKPASAPRRAKSVAR